MKILGLAKHAPELLVFSKDFEKFLLPSIKLTMYGSRDTVKNKTGMLNSHGLYRWSPSCGVCTYLVHDIMSNYENRSH